MCGYETRTLMRSSVWIIRRRGGGSDDDDDETLPTFAKTQINAMPLEELKAAAIARKLVKPNTKAQMRVTWER